MYASNSTNDRNIRFLLDPPGLPSTSALPRASTPAGTGVGVATTSVGSSAGPAFLLPVLANKFYAVAVGRVPGVYLTWADTLIQVERFPNCLHAKFPSARPVSFCFSLFTFGLQPAPA